MERRQPRNPPANPLVLIVDDDPDTRDMYADCLSAMGWETIGAADGEEAYRRAWESHPDVIVTDLALPRSDGWDLMGRVKKDARTRDIPVVVLTGCGSPELENRARDEGCAAVLTKPCLPDELAARLREILRVSGTSSGR